MEQYDQIVQLIALSMGAAWASGLTLYAAVLMLGLLGSTGHLVLPEQLHILQDPLVLGAAGVMFFIEFFVDKTPGADSAWDGLHTLIRIPAGALLAAGAVGELSAPVQLVAGLAGGTLAAGTHATKAGSRALINTSPEPFSNWTASLVEDLSVIGGLWLALNEPWLFLVLLAGFVALMIWLLPKIWRGLKRLAATIRRLFGHGSTDGGPATDPAGGTGPPSGAAAVTTAAREPPQLPPAARPETDDDPRTP